MMKLEEKGRLIDKDIIDNIKALKMDIILI